MFLFLFQSIYRRRADTTQSNPATSGEKQHALLSKNNSYPLKSTTTTGSDLLSVPDRFDTFMSCSSSNSSLWCQAFLESDESQNDLASLCCSQEVSLR